MTLLATRSLNTWALPKSVGTRILVLVKYSRIVIPIDRVGSVVSLSCLIKLILAHEHLTGTSCSLSPCDWGWIWRGYALCGFWRPILLVMVLIVLSLVCCLGPLIAIWGSLSTLILTLRLVRCARLLFGLVWARWSLNNDLISTWCGIGRLPDLRLRPLSRIVMIRHGSCILLVSFIHVILLRFKCIAALKVLLLIFLLLQITFEIACLRHMLVKLRRLTA